jgi:ATP-binding cassette subfamily B protein
MPVVRTFDDGSSSFKRYNEALHRYKKTLKEWMNTSGNSARIAMLTLSPLPTLIVVLFCGLFFLHEQTTTLSAFIAALFLSTGMADALMPVMWLSNFIKKSQSAALSIQDIFEVSPLQQSPQTLVPKDSTIEFKNVTFQYDNVNQEALKNINFTVPQGSVTALVGPSGAGKSTIAKLIPRFWDVTSGSIHIGGVNIKEIESKILMDTVSFVFQDTFLFQDTLFNNIQMANTLASDEAVYEAARSAQIHDFILSLPQGYDTKAGDRGANLSGGQKQRITIARAILRDAPIVVLDEATAFADPQNEEEIIKALANLMEHKTVIVIAHRLSTIKDVDQIVVFDKGEIVQKGKHETLLQTQGVYYNLWENYIKAQSWDLHKQETTNEQE